MLKKARELIEDEMVKHEGRYHDAGVWCALNWVLEEADMAAKREATDTLSAVAKEKSFAVKELGKAKEELRGRKVERVGRTAEGHLYTRPLPVPDGAKATFYAGVLEGLDIAIEILKEAGAANAMATEER